MLLPRRAEALLSSRLVRSALPAIASPRVNREQPNLLQLAAGGAILSSVLTLHDGEDGQAVLRGAGLVGWRRARLLGRRKEHSLFAAFNID